MAVTVHRVYGTNINTRTVVVNDDNVRHFFHNDEFEVMAILEAGGVDAIDGAALTKGEFNKMYKLHKIANEW